MRQKFDGQKNESWNSLQTYVETPKVAPLGPVTSTVTKLLAGTDKSKYLLVLAVKEPEEDWPMVNEVLETNAIVSVMLLS